MVTSRLALSAAAALAAALLLTGCAWSPGGQSPESSATPDDGGTTAPVSSDDVEAAWLDDGRMFAIVTWGSSTCIPVVDEITAEGQNVAVSLIDAPSADGAEQACTADLAPRASVGAFPEGVDPTKDVEFTVTMGDVTDDVDLDGNAALTGVPGDTTEFAPSAGWFDDEGIVLLTWGSSTCPPMVEGVEEQAGGATVTFTTQDGVCTMDMAGRATVIGLSDDDAADDDADRDDGEFTLTLVGDNLDGTVSVIRG
ncbi:hypothetical protein [Microbacterium abyssi]|uniref:hypothetical protein n=1 Tax=Microbacterium abyssi TaxID=2782166 RepID=UPI0018881CAE|nr:hypothetical protein [Microbacterium sp. A18JL241]